MKSFILLSVILTTLGTTSTFSQMPGNQVYRNSYNRHPQVQSAETILLGDSAILVSANILLNTVADDYIVTLGLHEEGKTIRDCNAQMTKRIEAFKAALRKLGISDKDMYVDFITQAKIYNYNIVANKAEEFDAGFEVKKNIIIKLNDLNTMDQLLSAASENDIYDIVKIDYVVNDAAKIYDQLIATASDVIRKKKDTYQRISSFELSPASKIYSENFYCLYPADQYKAYQAYEASSVSSDSYKTSLIRKDERKSRTFYYDGISQSGFDKVINPSTTIVGVQYVLELKIRYDIVRK